MNELRTIDPFALDPFDDAFRSLLRPWRMEMPQAAPSIKIDLTEQDGSYAVKAEIPGVKKDDIDVRVDGNMVTISAEVKKEKEEKEGEKVIRSERYYGSVSRSFTVSHDVDENAASAKYNEGVLELTLPKKPGGSARQVKVS